jgi:acetyl esterase/lipase
MKPYTISIVLPALAFSLALLSGCNLPASCKIHVGELKTYTTRDGADIPYSWEENITDPAAPVLVLIHGGQWTSGTRNHPTFYERHPALRSQLAQFNIASIDYRLFRKSSGENPYPVQRDDVLDFVQNIQQGGSKVCLLGVSSGGHIAATAAIKANNAIDCIVSIGGLYDFSTITPGGTLSIYHNAALEPESISPAESLTPAYNVPALIVHGLEDEIFDLSQAANYVAAINSITASNLASLVSFDEPGYANYHHVISPFGPSASNGCDSATAPAYGHAITDFIETHLTSP